MNLRTLLLMLVFSVSISAFSQEIDVTKLLADTKTFIFDNNKNTVKGFIYGELEAKTNCCGTDRIYLEVKIDPSGYVVQAKTLTGKNDCFKQSAADIVKNVKWNAADFKGPKSVYFEIKPDIACQEGKDNTYKQLDVTNNKLLDKNGERIPGAGVTPQVADNTTTTTTETPANTTPEETKAEPVKVEEKEETKVAANESNPPAENATETQKEEEKVAEKTETVSQTPPPTQVAENKTEPAQTEEKEETTPQPQVVPQNTTSTDQLQQAKTMAEAYRAVQDSEIEALKEQMAQKKAEREAEIKKEERRLAKIEARREAIRKRREAARQEAESEDDRFAFNTDENNNNESFGYDDDNTQFGYDDDGSDQEKTEEDRLNEELERLRQEREQMQQGLRDSDDQRRQAARDSERQAQDILRIEEEIQQREEDRERLREEKELARLREEQQQIEDDKRQRQDELQRLMDEIERLRNEADQRLADLERQEEEIKKVGEETTLREQEIEADRIRRQQEQIAALQVIRLEMQANAAGADPSTISAGSDMATAIAEAMGVKGDSADKLLPLIRTIAQLEAEIKRLQIEMANMQAGGTPSAAGSETTSNPIATTPYKSATLPENAGTLASEDRSWEEFEYKDPNADESIYRSAPKPQTPPTTPQNGSEGGTATDSGSQASENTENQVTVPDYEEGRGYSPASSHKDTHTNVEGPQFSNLEYGEGRDAMKKYITDKLKSGGVCGLAQTFAEVTVNPNGDVVSYKVLKANSERVEALLPPILQSLKFNKTNLRFNQNSYIEFKADINCTEQEKLDLKKVKDYVGKEVTSN